MYGMCLGIGGGLDVYAVPLSGGRFSAVLLNRSPETADITLHFADLSALGVSAAGTVVKANVRDILKHKEEGERTSRYTTAVASHGVAHVILTPNKWRSI